MNSLFESYVSKKDNKRRNPLYDKFITVGMSDLLENENKEIASLKTVKIRNFSTPFAKIFLALFVIGFILLSIILGSWGNSGKAAFEGVGIYMLIIGMIFILLSLIMFFLRVNKIKKSEKEFYGDITLMSEKINEKLEKLAEQIKEESFFSTFSVLSPYYKIINGNKRLIKKSEFCCLNVDLYINETEIRINDYYNVLRLPIDSLKSIDVINKRFQILLWLGENKVNSPRYKKLNIKIQNASYILKSYISMEFVSSGDNFSIFLMPYEYEKAKLLLSEIEKIKSGVETNLVCTQNIYPELAFLYSEKALDWLKKEYHINKQSSIMLIGENKPYLAQYFLDHNVEVNYVVPDADVTKLLVINYSGYMNLKINAIEEYLQSKTICDLLFIQSDAFTHFSLDSITEIIRLYKNLGKEVIVFNNRLNFKDNIFLNAETNIKENCNEYICYCEREAAITNRIESTLGKDILVKSFMDYIMLSSTDFANFFVGSITDISKEEIKVLKEKLKKTFKEFYPNQAMELGYTTDFFCIGRKKD